MFRSEIATLKFLKQNTTVPVPDLIGYGEHPYPFMIIQHVAGTRLDVVWSEIRERLEVEGILRSLAEIQLELLAHPFNSSGMLLEIANGGGPTVSVGPCSLDEFEAYENGISHKAYPPFRRSSDFYDYKIELWSRQLNEQPNSVTSSSDGNHKFLAAGIMRQLVKDVFGKETDDGLFYLAHPDLHSGNVIVTDTWPIADILDREGACTMPLSVACTIPTCVSNIACVHIVPNSAKYHFFQSRATSYHRHFTEAELLRQSTNKPAVNSTKFPKTSLAE